MKKREVAGGQIMDAGSGEAQLGLALWMAGLVALEARPAAPRKAMISSNISPLVTHAPALPRKLRFRIQYRRSLRKTNQMSTVLLLTLKPLP